MKEIVSAAVGSLFLLFGLANPPKHPLAGAWSGTVDTAGVKVRLSFRFMPLNDSYYATLDSPDQRIRGIPVDEILHEKDSVKLGVSVVNARFDGVYRRDSLLTGVWQQAGRSLPLKLRRTK